MTNGGRRGSIRKDASGKWYFVVDVDLPGNKRRQARRRGFSTKRAAQAALTELLGKLDGGSYVEPSKLTVRQYVETRWLPAIEDGLRPSTFASYSRNMRVQVLPRIGAIRLQALDPATLQALYGELRREGRSAHRGGGGLSARTVDYIHSIIRNALRTAVEWDLIPRNPADRTKPPRQKARADRHTKIRTWTRAELRAFLTATRDETLYPLWLLLATTGMRRGEALELAWSALDLDAGRVSIRRTLVDVTTVEEGRRPTFHDPKTTRGTRVVALDAATVATLRDWRTEQAKNARGTAANRRTISSSPTTTDARAIPATRPARSSGASAASGCRASGFTTCGIPGQVWRWKAVCIRKSSPSDSAIPRSPSRWRFAATSCRACRPTRLPASRGSSSAATTTRATRPTTPTATRPETRFPRRGRARRRLLTPL
jgi:integrase